MRYIVGHVSPDWDAICSLWLLQRFGGFASADIKLVNTGSPDPAVLAGAAAVVDTGRIYDKYNNRFDHHQFVGAAANETCAARQVWMHFKTGVDLEYLAPLIDLIYAGDTGKPGAAQSRQLGIHALLSGEKASGSGDLGIIAFGYDILDALATHLKRADEARMSLAEQTVYRSVDGLLIALNDAPQGATDAAFEAGALLVVWHNPMDGTVAVGISRAPGRSGADCGRLVKAVMWANAGTLVWEEVSTWYRHAAGFFAGRGTPKAPDPRPLDVPLADIAAALDAAWLR